MTEYKSAATVQAILLDCIKAIEMLPWEDWKPLHPPSEQTGKGVYGYAFSGIYHIRDGATKRNIVVGIGCKLISRIRSWYPAPYGAGTRNNSGKRSYIFKHWHSLEFRVLRTEDILEAAFIESTFLAGLKFEFQT